MFKVYEKAYNKGNIVSIYTNTENTDKFAAGFISEINEKELLISNVSPSGKYDGYAVKNIKDIFMILQDGKYDNKLTKLYTLQKQQHNYNDTVAFENLYLALLNFAQKNDLIVAIQLIYSGYDDVIGFVDSIDGEEIAISAIDSSVNIK